MRPTRRPALFKKSSETFLSSGKDNEQQTKFRLVAGAVLSPARPNDPCMEQWQACISASSRLEHKPEQQLPSRVDLRGNIVTPIQDQMDQPICVAQSVCYRKQEDEYDERKFRELFSPHSIYNRRKDSQKNEGMTLPDALSIVQTYGVNTITEYPEKRIWPQDFNLPRGTQAADIPRTMDEKTIALFKKDSETFDYNFEESVERARKLHDSAAKNRIASFARIHTLQSLKRSIYENGVSLVIVMVYNDNMEFYRPSKYRYNSLGAHCVAIVGYEDDARNSSRGRFILRNSWGKNWGDQGDFYIPYRDFDYLLEIWTAVDGNFLSGLQQAYPKVASVPLNLGPAAIAEEVQYNEEEEEEENEKNSKFSKSGQFIEEQEEAEEQEAKEQEQNDIELLKQIMSYIPRLRRSKNAQIQAFAQLLESSFESD